MASCEWKVLFQHALRAFLTLTAIACPHSISAYSFVRKAYTRGSVHCYVLNAMVTHDWRGREGRKK
jgi:hypothetical protein